MHEADNQRDTIAFLSGGMWDVPGEITGAPMPPTRVDTHGALVFLGRDLVLKLKRAVDLGYLDYTTLAARKAACLAEVQLNRRTAPELYLGLWAVVRNMSGGLELVAGEVAGGPVVDWLVAMRRFGDGDLLAEVAARKGLTAPMMRALADAIAAFHDQAPVSPHGGAGAMAAVIDGNLAAMRACEDLWPQGAAERLHAASHAGLARVAALLDQRCAQGRVRHGHGDLHLGNICLWHGAPTLFDCLEFDARLARVDVLYDLAFLLMDLWQRGEHHAASLVMNRYLDRAGGADGLAAMPLFMSVRAAVRAHVAAAAAHQLSDAARDAKRTEALAYIAAAEGFLADARQVQLVAVGGLSGTGKSVLAGHLAAGMGAAPGARWLRSDTIRKHLAGVAPEQRLPASAYTPEASAEVYARMMAQARAVLASGWPVVLDAVFAREAERRACEALAADSHCAFTGLWLEAPPDVLAMRVTARARDMASPDASDADSQVVVAQATYALGAIAPWHRINAARPPADVAFAAECVLGG